MIKYPPEIKIERISQEKVGSDEDFLAIEKTVVNFHYPNGSISDNFKVFSVLDKADAVAIVLHFKQNDKRMVYLRSCVRPALMLRDFKICRIKEERGVGNLWEIPAGLVDIPDHELTIKKLKEEAAREVKEEVGFDLDISKLNFLGKRIFGAPGTHAGRIFLFESKVNPKDKKDPITDNSPMEKFGEVIIIELNDALDCIDKGLIIDPKTEIGLRRLDKLYEKEN
jgi:ADP-ribose pyrophosphatase